MLNEKRSCTDASIVVVNGCIACICSWLLVIYILHVRERSCSYLSASGFAIIKKQHLSSFVAGRGTLVSCIFMSFSINFQTSSCGRFVCFFADEIAFVSILRNELKRFTSGTFLFLAKEISASFQF